ncbi:MAG: sensor histidine kinase [Micrococcales bacterium]
MRLRTRLFLATAAVTTITAAAVGLAGTLYAFDSEVKRLDKVLAKVADDATAAAPDQISAAIESAADRSFAVQVSILDTQGLLTNVYGVENIIEAAPAPALAAKAQEKPITVEAIETYRMSSVAIDSGDYLLLIMPLQDAVDARNANLGWLGGFIVVAVGLGILVIWLLIRLDLRVMERLVQAAKGIASGQEVSLPDTKRSGEVAELSQALAQMLEALRGSIAAEQNAHKAMQSFMGDASHELRTPLTVIKGYSELLQQQGADAEFRNKALPRMLSEVARMEQLINDLLLLAELGEKQLGERDRIDLTRIVGEFVEDLKTLQPKRVVTVKIAKNLKVMGSGAHLHQLLSNLFGNLRKHTPIDAEVRVSLSSAGTDQVLLTVEDAGPGLPEHYYDDGVESFVRFDAFASRAQGSSGLGMTIMRTIVDQQGGRMRLSRSELGGLKTEIYLARK